MHLPSACDRVAERVTVPALAVRASSARCLDRIMLAGQSPLVGGTSSNSGSGVHADTDEASADATTAISHHGRPREGNPASAYVAGRKPGVRRNAELESRESRSGTLLQL